MAEYINVQTLLQTYCDNNYRMLHNLVVNMTCFIDQGEAFFKATIIPFNTPTECYQFNALTSTWDYCEYYIRWDWFKTRLRTEVYYDGCLDYTKFESVWVNKNNLTLRK